MPTTNGKRQTVTCIFCSWKNFDSLALGFMLYLMPQLCNRKRCCCDGFETCKMAKRNGFVAAAATAEERSRELGHAVAS